MAEMNDDERRAVARIVKVNHAGEYGAIRIYRAQMWIARRFYPDAAPALGEILHHEIRHCARFREAMTGRDAQPCRIMALWGIGGYALGLLTAALGRRGIWVCTAAVEAAVHRHFQEQLSFLRGRDEDLLALISDIQVEELSHLDHARHQMGAPTRFAGLLDRAISVATDLVIWMSTQGAVTRMSRQLAAASDHD